MTNQEAIEVMFNEWKCIDRNDGVHCDRKCESCDLVMDVQIIREAFNKAISALEAQEAKAQLSAEGTTSDLISRQAAIDRINKQREHLQPDIYPQDKIGDAAYRICAEFIERLPSAQPEKRTEERTETHACDCISRQAAIEAVMDEFKRLPTSAIRAKTRIEALPSAQHERNRGKWIDAVLPNDNGGLPVQVCDQCNTFFPLAYTGGGHNFCPNCGADMKEEDT